MKNLALVVAFVVLVAVTAGMAACKTSPTPTSNPTPTLAPTPTSTPVPIAAEEILGRAAQAVAGLHSAHFVLVMSLTGEQPLGKGDLPLGKEARIDASGQVASPDRLKQTMTITIGGMSVKRELVLIGHTAYILLDPATGQWQQFQSDKPPGAAFEPGKFADIVGKGVKSATRLSDEEIDGVATYRVKVNLDPEALPLVGQDILKDSVRQLETEVWIDKESFLVRQLSFSFEGQILYVGDVSVEGTLKLSQFNQPVTIEPPA